MALSDHSTKGLLIKLACSTNTVRTGGVCYSGTASFINSEQWGFRLRGGSVDTDAEPADVRSELYALGVTLYLLLTAPPATPLIQRDPTMLWKLLLGFSALLNLLLVYWLVFLPR